MYGHFLCNWKPLAWSFMWSLRFTYPPGLSFFRNECSCYFLAGDDLLKPVDDGSALTKKKKEEEEEKYQVAVNSKLSCWLLCCGESLHLELHQPLADPSAFAEMNAHDSAATAGAKGKREKRSANLYIFIDHLISPYFTQFFVSLLYREHVY